jgi:signal peptidase II
MRKRTGIVLVLLLVALDQYVKHLVETRLPFHEPVPVFAFLSWYRTWNEGIAFSMLAFLNDWALVAVTVVIVIFVLWLWKSTPREKWLSHFGFALVIGGAIGNLIDRVALGHVVDFVLLHHGSWSFAIFNLADAFITTGAVAIVADEVFGRHDKSIEKGADDD